MVIIRNKPRKWKSMKWEEVCKLHPNKYLKLNFLDFYIKDDKKIVADVAVIDRIEDSIKATKELLKSKGDTIVYHTGADKIIIEMRKLTGLRVFVYDVKIGESVT